MGENKILLFLKSVKQKQQNKTKNKAFFGFAQSSAENLTSSVDKKIKVTKENKTKQNEQTNKAIEFHSNTLCREIMTFGTINPK